jgi:hypothetical protein
MLYNVDDLAVANKHRHHHRSLSVREFILKIAEVVGLNSYASTCSAKKA